MKKNQSPRAVRTRRGNTLWIWVFFGILIGLYLLTGMKEVDIIDEGFYDEGELLDDEIFLFLLEEEEEELY
jgi:hypothetical protein